MSRQHAVGVRGARSCVARSLPGFQVVAHTLGAGRIATHRVDRPVVAAMITGRCETSIAGRQFESHGEQAWCEPGGEKRANHVLTPGAQILSVVPDERDSSGLLDRLLPALARPAQRTSADIALAARRVWVELDDGDTAASLAIMGHVIVLLSTFARPEREAHHVRGPAWLPRVVDYLRAHYRDPLTLSDVARIAGVEPAHLCRVFQRHTGCTVAEHIRTLRVAWAARRLAEVDLPIASIALEAGFSDQSHLTKTFRAHMGVTPAVYRGRFR